MSPQKGTDINEKLVSLLNAYWLTPGQLSASSYTACQQLARKVLQASGNLAEKIRKDPRGYSREIQNILFRLAQNTPEVRALIEHLLEVEPSDQPSRVPPISPIQISTGDKSQVIVSGRDIIISGSVTHHVEQSPQKLAEDIIKSNEVHMAHQDDLKKLINVHMRRLQKLKKQRAIEGISVDPKILIEIEDIEAELQGLRTQLKAGEDDNTRIKTKELHKDEFNPLQATIDETTLRQMIKDQYSLQQVKTLCQDCGVDYDELGELPKEALIRELIRALKRRGQLGILVNKVSRQA